VAYVGVVEFQKRGLPHIHLLVTMAEDDKPITPEDVNRVISAEIPDKNAGHEEEVHYNLVDKFMVHRKCGEFNPDAPCMKKRRTRAQGAVPANNQAQTEPVDNNGNIFVEDIDDEEYEQPIEQFLANHVLNLPGNDARIEADQAESDRYSPKHFFIFSANLLFVVKTIR
jgi:hypothetical protein